mgnify:CR=1 FL=1|jgi:hypothetical protein
MTYRVADWMIGFRGCHSRGVVGVCGKRAASASERRAVAASSTAVAVHGRTVTGARRDGVGDVRRGRRSWSRVEQALSGDGRGERNNHALDFGR